MYILVLFNIKSDLVDPQYLIYYKKISNMSFSFYTQLYFKTKNAWQSLVHSPLGIVMSPPSDLPSSSETLLPPGERRQTNPSADRRLLYTVESSKLWSYRSEAHQIIPGVS